MSLVVKYEWNGIVLLSLSTSGLFDPVWCRNSRCTITISAIMSGMGKCSVKNRMNVALSTANPPHTY
jgi:hypothetical protein